MDMNTLNMNTGEKMWKARVINKQLYTKYESQKVSLV